MSGKLDDICSLSINFLAGSKMRQLNMRHSKLDYEGLLERVWGMIRKE